MRVCIFCGGGSSNNPEVEKVAKNLMKEFHHLGIELVYGGASIGIMGTLANELLARGGRVTGVIPEKLMTREIAHDQLTELVVVTGMHERKKLMYDRSDAFLILPGGMGTLDELFEILTWKQLGYHSKPIAILNIDHYYDSLLAFLDHAVNAGLVKAKDREYLFHSSEWDNIWNYFCESVK